ncbi:hypothetical protein J2X24_002110 [Asticcacaulis solisilvae]|nr:hypothetical protein [Asticcacaulis solisilvae]MDR6800630.1 hypothetical protein [Asticcacaulis sp. BE141]
MGNPASILNRPLTASDYARKARALFRLAGSSDEPETRVLLNMGAIIHLSAARAAKAVAHG